MAEVADDNWVFPLPHSVYMLYPQALDMKQVVANITHRLPVSEAPIFNQTIRFLNVSSTVCVPEKEALEPLDAIIMVKSGVYNFADRERIRQTYAPEAVRKAGLRVAVVFSVGLPRISGGRFFQRDGFNISLPDRAGKSLEVMQSERPEVIRQLTEEAQLHGDLLLGDYEDTYYNLSLKLFYTFQWASSFCRGYFTQDQQQVRPPVFIVLDDDYAFNASVLKAELRNLSDTEIRRVTWGIPFNQSKLFRYPFNKKYDKWALSKREMPWPHLAPYAPSIFLVFGVDVLREIALAMYFTRQIPVDDAWLGLIMTKLDLYFERRPHMYKFVPKKVQKEVVLSAPYEYLYGSL
ncbi:unnamed protein product [Dibothriocephalus latus]|uniref:Hexosyltransferase n=1 Tax=Dibothriocephalus latus TaxID=60516 RepID=A0A3P7L8J7_DIBLA|nr:unnamed protein product [Dibothriocephalus latus]